MRAKSLAAWILLAFAVPFLTGTVTILPKLANPPTTSTDNSVVRWGGVDGDTLQDSALIVDDVGNASTASITLSGASPITLTDTVWEDLRVPMTAVKAAGVRDPGFIKFKDDGAASTGVFAHHFDKSAEEELFFSAQMSHMWKEGTDLKPHVHWAPSDSGAGNVGWGLACTWDNISGTYGNTTITTVTAAAGGVADKHILSSFPDISGSGKTFSSMLVCRVFRSAAVGADTYDDDAALLELDFHYEIDKI